MALKSGASVVIVYNSLMDPLTQNLMVRYMLTLTQRLPIQLHLLTFEQPEYQLNLRDQDAMQSYLAEHHVRWYPSRHHTGGWILAKKAFDFISILPLMFRLRVSGVKIIWSFANVAASIGWVYATLLRMKTVIFSYEPHSEFMADLHLWSKSSLKFRLLNYLERKASEDAAYILTGTRFMVEELKRRNIKGQIFRAPTAVDEDDFFFRPGARVWLQERHNITYDEKVVLYIGKFGGLYYSQEIAFLFKVIQTQLTKARFIVVTSNDKTEVENWFREVNFDFSRITILPTVSYEEVKLYISGADIGISAVPPSPAQKFRSPTKVAEYLLCGLPYLTVKGVSEDDLVAEGEEVGVVVDKFDDENCILAAIPAIRRILSIERSIMIERCRNVGLKYRSKHHIDYTLHLAFSELLGQFS